MRGGLVAAVPALLLAVFAAVFGAEEQLVPIEPVLAGYGLSLQGGKYACRYVLRKGGVTCSFGPGMGCIVVNGEAFPVDEPPRFRQGELVVSRGFLAVLKARFVDRTGEYWQTVVLDPGHGGKDTGAISPWNGLREKHVVLDIARAAKACLESKGVKVKMTRTRDVFVPLEQRPLAANRCGAQLFVSIHADACPDSSVEGVTVYYGADWPESHITVATRARYLAERLNPDAFSPGARYYHYDPSTKKFLLGLILRESNKEGKILASRIAEKLSRGLGTYNRGVRTKNLRVIRRCLCPAVLVEVGYLTNPREARRLARAEYRRKAGRLLAEAVCGFLRERVKKK